MSKVQHSSEKDIKKWSKTIPKHFLRIEENKEFKVIHNSDDKLTSFLIKLTPISGFHKDQVYILEFITRYIKGSKEMLFPFSPPKVKFLSKVFHSNVYGSGDICLDSLNTSYSPAFGFNGIINTIIALLNDPNPASAANGAAGTLEKKFTAEYKLYVKNSPKMTEDERDAIKYDIFAEYIQKIKQHDNYNNNVYKTYESRFI